MKLGILFTAFVFNTALVETCFSQTQILATSGHWSTFGGNSTAGDAICGVQASSRANERSIHIKYFAGSNSIVVHIFKKGWNIPADTKLQVSLAIDSNALWFASAIGQKNFIEFHINKDNVDVFFKQMRLGKMMKINFLDGDEESWIANLFGSNRAVDAMLNCVISINQNASTQPFTPRSTPLSSRPTQPFGASAPQLPLHSISSPTFNPSGEIIH